MRRLTRAGTGCLPAAVAPPGRTVRIARKERGGKLSRRVVLLHRPHYRHADKATSTASARSLRGGRPTLTGRVRLASDHHRAACCWPHSPAQEHAQRAPSGLAASGKHSAGSFARHRSTTRSRSSGIDLAHPAGADPRPEVILAESPGPPTGPRSSPRRPPGWSPRRGSPAPGRPSVRAGGFLDPHDGPRPVSRRYRGRWRVPGRRLRNPAVVCRRKAAADGTARTPWGR